jgi:hypothetical protein
MISSMLLLCTVRCLVSCYPRPLPTRESVKNNRFLSSFSIQHGSAKERTGLACVERVSEATASTVVPSMVVAARKSRHDVRDEESFSVGSNAGRSFQPIGKVRRHVASQRIYRNLSDVTSSPWMTTTTSTKRITNAVGRTGGPPTSYITHGDRSYCSILIFPSRYVSFFTCAPASFLVADTT